MALRAKRLAGATRAAAEIIVQVQPKVTAAAKRDRIIRCHDEEAVPARPSMDLPTLHRMGRKEERLAGAKDSVGVHPPWSAYKRPKAASLGSFTTKSYTEGPLRAHRTTSASCHGQRIRSFPCAPLQVARKGALQKCHRPSIQNERVRHER